MRVIVAGSMSAATLIGAMTLAVGADAASDVGAPDRLQDHERARAAVVVGARLPLSQLLRRMEIDHPGRVLEVELEFDEALQRDIYEIEILDDGGRVIEIFVDALDGRYVEEPED